MSAEASMVFIGNTKHTVPYMLKNSDLFDEVPENYHDSAILDRFHCYIPGWEVDVIRREMFTSGYGFVVDYLAEALKTLRNYDYSTSYKPYFSLSTEISTRDLDGIQKTFSGLMKIIHPSGNATPEELEILLKYSIASINFCFNSLMFSMALVFDLRIANCAYLMSEVTAQNEKRNLTQCPIHVNAGTLEYLPYRLTVRLIVSDVTLQGEM
jgi:hypothetical protein